MIFSRYSKRIWDIKYKGTEIHLVFVERINSGHYMQNLEVTWTTSKFKGVKFSFTVPFDIEMKIRWDKVFKHLRRSLSYGLNQNARQVTDILLGIKKNHPHPIHHMVRTSKAL